MSSVDNRVVKMSFDNAAFERNVSTSMKTLSDLEKSLKLAEGTKGLEDVEKASRSFSMDSVGDAVQSIADRFSTLGIIGMTALQSITNTAIDLGGKLWSAIYGPLVEGGKTRALNIEQAKFQFEGLGIDVEKAMAAASYAVNDTAYSLDAAAKAAAQFAASGLEDFDEMGTALRAISGVAAMTSSSYDDIARVFTSVAGNGRLMGQQLLQLSGRGINAAATLATYLGKSEAEVRKMVSAGQISFELFYTAMDEAFGEHAKKANETFSGSMSNVRANLSRIGADVATSSLENFKNVNNALIPVLKQLHKELGPVIDSINEAQTRFANFAIGKLENVSFRWLTESIPEGIKVVKNLAEVAMSVVNPITTAWRNIFPKATADTFINTAKALQNLTSSLKLNEENAANLERTFSGLFAVLNIVRRGFVAVGEGIGNFIKYVAPAGSSILSFTGYIGDLLVDLDKAIEKSNLFGRAMEWLATTFAPVGEAIENTFNNIVAGVKEFLNVDTDAVIKFAKRTYERLQPLTTIGTLIQTVFFGIVKVFRSVAAFLKPATDLIAEAFGNLKDLIMQALREGDFKPILDLVNGGIFTGILAGVGKFINAMTTTVKKGGLLGKLQTLLGGVQQSLSAFTQSIKAGTLQKIAIAIAILAGALLVLATIPSDKLMSSLGAVSVLMVELFASMGIFEKIMGSSGFKAMPKIAASMILLGAAILVLSFAVRTLAKLDWEGLGKGLAGVAGLSAVLVASAKLLQGSTGPLIKGAGGLVIFAAAVLILVQAVKQLSKLDWVELAKGLVGVGVLLGEIIVFTKLAGKMSVGTAVGILILSAAIIVLAQAVKQFAAMAWEDLGKGFAALGAMLLELGLFTKLVGGTKGMVAIGIGLVLVGAALQIMTSVLRQMGALDWEEIGKGITTLGASLIIVGLAMQLMPKNMIGIGIGLIAVATALILLQKALAAIGGMTWEEIAKGLSTLAVSLGILGLALIGMTGSLAGSAALLIASAALIVLAGALFLLGSMSIETIAQGLIALAAAMIIMGAGAAIMAPLTLALLGFSAAMILFGAGILAAGAGLIALAIGLNLLSAASAVGIPILLGIVAAVALLLAFSGPMLVMSGVLLVFGAALLIFAVGLVALAAGFTTLGVSSAIGLNALRELAWMVEEIAPLALDMLALGGALIVFGLGAVAAGAGILVLGLAFIVLGAGLAVMALAGPEGAAGLEYIAEAAVGLLLAAPALTIVGVALTAFGIGALAAGAGALVAGAGFVVLAIGLDAFNVASPEAVSAMAEIAILAPLMLVASVPILALGAAFLVFGAGALVGGAGALVAGEGLQAMAKGFRELDKVGNSAVDILSDITDLSWDLTKAAPGLTLGGAGLISLGNGAKKLGEGLQVIGSQAINILTVAQSLIQMGDEWKSLLETARKTATSMGEVTQNMVNKMLSIMNKSIPLFGTAGQTLITNGFDKGISSAIPGAEQNIQSFMNLLIQAVRSRQNDWHSSGNDAGQGFIDGLGGKIGEAANTAAQLAIAASNAINTNLKIRSPSRITMRSGGFTGEGFIVGFHPYIAKAAEMGEEMGIETVDALTLALSSIDDVVDADLVTDPVITPLVDLENVHKAVDEMATLFGGQRVSTSAALARRVSSSVNESRAVAESEGGTAIVNEYNFTQNNNSPKALSRLDLYRQTKNLFGIAKEALDQP